MRKKIFGPDIFILILALLSLAPAAAEAACVNPPSGLVSWWGGDNNALDIVGTNNGTLVGSATYAAGLAGQAFSFDGSENGYVEIPNTSSLNPGGAFSVGGWFYIDPAASGNAGEIATLVAKTEGSTNNGWALYFDDRWSTKSLKFVLGSVLELQNAIPTAGWYHIAGVYDPATSPNSRLYINGEMAAHTDCGGATANSLNARIGAMHWTDSYHQGNDRLNGKADEVQFFNRALPGNEILAIYNAGSSGVCRPCAARPSGLVSWWGGDGNSLDLAGTNNGTLVNGTAYSIGKVGQAFSLDGIDDYVSIPYSSKLDLQDSFSIEAWVNPHAFGAGTKNIAGKAGGYQLYLEADGRVTFGFYTGVNWWLASSVSVLALDTWSHVVGTFNSSTGAITIYINGVADNGLNTGWTPAPNSNNLEIGGFSCCGNFFRGLIDEVRIFNRALTTSEIAAAYNAGSTGICAIDTIPDAFTFISQTGTPLTTTIISNPISVTGINAPAPMSIAGGEYSVSTDGGGTWGSWTSVTGTVSVNSMIKVRQTSSASNSTLTTTTLNIGGATADFDVTTAAEGDPSANGLVSWWKGDGNPYDSVGGNHGALQSGTTYAAGHDGQAFSFNGSTDFVRVLNPQNIPVGNSARTISAWVRSSGGTNLYQGIVGYGTPAAGQVLFFEWGGNAEDLNRLYTMNLSWGARGATLLTYDTWYHVALIHDGSNTKLYVNGRLDANEVMTQNTVMNGAGLRIGLSPDFDGWHRYFKGLIDEIKIYSRALSASEVSRLAGTYPDAFDFTPQTGVNINTVVESNSITVTGITNPASISITGGEYSVSSDGGSTWSAYSSSVPSTVSLSNQVKVRQTSSSSYSTTTTATLTIGSRSGRFSVTTMPIPVYTLTVTKVGNGTVTAIPDGGSTDMLSWNGNTGTADFNSGTQVSLAASASTGYTFYGWSGACTGNGTPCLITIDSTKSLTATFDDYTDPGPVCNNPPFKINGTMANYPTIKDAYDGLGGGETLQIRALNFVESGLNLDQSKNIGLSGGYDCGFTTNAGFTTIQNSMTISGGSVTVEKLVIQ